MVGNMKDDKILISIIVPVYKAEQYLHQCIDSILSQTLQDFELILVDDGSPDNCGAICDEYLTIDKRVKVVHKFNGGVSSARNTGLAQANGEWICFVDSDDILLPTYLSDFEINTADADIYFQGYVKKRGETIVERHNFAGCPSNDLYTILSYAEDNCIINSPCFKLYKSSIVREYNILFDTNTSYGEDHLFSLTYSLYINKAHFSMGEGYIYRLSATESLTQRVVPYKEITYYSLAAKRLQDEISKRENGKTFLPSIGLTFMTNYIRTLKYCMKADSHLSDYKWVRNKFKRHMTNISTRSLTTSYKLLRLITVSPLYMLIYPLFRLIKDR